MASTSPTVNGEYHFYFTPNTFQSPGTYVPGNAELTHPHQRLKMKRARPWFLYFCTFIQVAAMIGEMGWNWYATGLPIEISPNNFNYLIGPSTGIIIQMGARWAPCMKISPSFNSSSVYNCPAGIIGDIKISNKTYCSTETICGMGMVRNQPNQWWRFFTAIFLHGGVVHLLMNMSFQVRSCFTLEQDIGSIRIAIIYMLSGVGGFVFSGIFSGNIPSVGCSGSLYGLLAVILLDLFHNWKMTPNPWKELMVLIITIIFSFALGLLPYIDNFAHVGGFLIGLVSGLWFMPNIYYGKWDRRLKKLFKWLSIPLTIGLVTAVFVAFYTNVNGSECQVCKYITCIPGMPWCDQKWSSFDKN